MATTKPPSPQNGRDEIRTVSAENRRDLTVARILESDLDISSLSIHPSPSSSPRPQSPLRESLNVSVATSSDLHTQQLDDRVATEAETKKMPEDLNDEVFRVYFKGMMNEERVGDSSSTVTLAGIGVAICDSRDELIYELRKPLGMDELSRRGVECKALIEGMHAAIDLGLKRIVLYFDYYPLYQFVTGQWSSRQRNIAAVLNQVAPLRNKFTYCGACFIARNDIKFAFKLARDAISSQVNKPEDSISAEKETCVICFEDSNVGQIFSVEGCMHRYCFSCMNQHAEAKLFNGLVPKCPHEGCNSELKIDSCGIFLPPKLIEIMKVRVKEASIPLTERIYCPFPKCSTLMSKKEVLEHHRTAFGGAESCIKCLGHFCINCKVPWHSNMTCSEYNTKNPNPHAEDAKLKTLAASNLWRQCVKCNHMIELAAGCYHVTCRCGYEFCYSCGVEWNNKKAACDCPLWDDENVINGDDEIEDEYDEYESEEDDDGYDSESDD